MPPRCLQEEYGAELAAEQQAAMEARERKAARQQERHRRVAEAQEAWLEDAEAGAEGKRSSWQAFVSSGEHLLGGCEFLVPLPLTRLRPRLSTVLPLFRKKGRGEEAPERKRQRLWRPEGVKRGKAPLRESYTQESVLPASSTNR